MASITVLHFEEELPKLRKAWFELGNESQEVVLKFVAYWITFNSFYGNAENGSERFKIRTFLKTRSLGETIDFDGENSPVQEYMRAPVFPGEKSPEEVDYLAMDISPNTKDKDEKAILNYQKLRRRSEAPDERLIALILMIYQVRCNLFHGSKNPTPDRNYALVDSAQKILEKLLLELLKSNNPNR